MTLPSASSAESHGLEAACRELYTSFKSTTCLIHAEFDDNKQEDDETIPIVLDVSREDNLNLLAHNIFHKDKHLAFLRKPIFESLNDKYLPLYASQPWIIFWCLHGMILMGDTESLNQSQR